MTNRRALLDALIRKDFLAFLQKAFSTVAPGDEFHGNWHLEAIAHQLARMSSGDAQRLIITVPPRSLKSIAISVAWVAWRLGHDPSLRFVCVSYSAELALKHARDCRLIMQSDWYQRCFPETVLSRERSAEHDFETTARGGQLSTSVGGTLTGRGGDIIVIDDPIKPSDAGSEVARKTTIEWYGGTLASRLNDKSKGAIVLVMQRLHENDLAGHLLEAGGWEQLSLPAIAVEDEEIPIGGGLTFSRRVGDLLHSDREPLHVLNGLRATMGSAVFSAQYQQAPTPAEGAMIQRAWLDNRYKRWPDKQPGDRIVQSWDCASKEGLQNDFSVCITALIRRRQIYILDVFRERLDFPKLQKRTIGLARRHRADVILVEDTASGTPLNQHLRDLQPEGVPLPIPRRPDGDKVTRMFGQTGRIEAGELVLPEAADWLAAFELEVLGFPNARHDDQVDALSQLLNWSSRAVDDWDIPVGPIIYTRDGRWDERDQAARW